ncbi:MAG TPA: hypothetical protein VM122_09905, partial [Usitatibacter sp.]|nr:hypothetical protein [Usitatibacter sp.]
SLPINLLTINQFFGKRFSPAEAQAFVEKPFAREAMRVRRWDDAAKIPGEPTPSLSHYLEIGARCAR